MGRANRSGLLPHLAQARSGPQACLSAELQGVDGVHRIQGFSNGMWAVAEPPSEQGSVILNNDRRMCQGPACTFSFAVTLRQCPPMALQPPQTVGNRIDTERALPWLWRRLKGERLAGAFRVFTGLA